MLGLQNRGGITAVWGQSSGHLRATVWKSWVVWAKHLQRDSERVSSYLERRKSVKMIHQDLHTTV